LELENNDSDNKVVELRSKPRPPMTERDMHMLTMYFQSESSSLSAIISQFYNTASTVAMIALVVAAVTSNYLLLFLLVPAAMLIVIAEMHVKVLRAMTLEYLRLRGIDISNAPKPLFHSFRQWFKRT
jgi:hypothetical protein